MTEILENVIVFAAADYMAMTKPQRFFENSRAKNEGTVCSLAKKINSATPTLKW